MLVPYVPRLNSRNCRQLLIIRANKTKIRKKILTNRLVKSILFLFLFHFFFSFTIHRDWNNYTRFYVCTQLIMIIDISFFRIITLCSMKNLPRIGQDCYYYSSKIISFFAKFSHLLIVETCLEKIRLMTFLFLVIFLNGEEKVASEFYHSDQSGIKFPPEKSICTLLCEIRLGRRMYELATPREERLQQDQTLSISLGCVNSSRSHTLGSRSLVVHRFRPRTLITIINVARR